MFFYEGYICPVCKTKFNETDDIVACPDCGAPHHRECWKQEGRCKYADDHGTPRQWKRPEDRPQTQQHNPPLQDSRSFDNVNTCSRCGKVNPEFAEFCSRCGNALKPPEWSSYSGGHAGGQQYGSPFHGGYGEYTPFHMPIMDPFGGVAPDEKIDGIAAEDLVTFIGPNSAYYLPRFYKMDRNKTRSSWNWMAFLFTPYWLLYRKNYLVGSIILVLSLISSLINGYIYTVFLFPKIEGLGQADMYSLISDGSVTLYLMIILLLFFISLMVRIIFGLIGNSIYQRTVFSRIRRIGQKTGMERVLNNDDQNDRYSSIIAEYRQELAARGGVSLVMVAVANGIVLFGQLLYQALIVL